MTKRKTFEITAEDSFWDELNRLAKISGITPAEVIDRAIGLYSAALTEIEKGKTIQFILPE
jgi:predicted DNA-binding ribbon-helix-helix protein